MASQDNEKARPFFHNQSKSEPLMKAHLCNTLQSIRASGEHNCRQIIKEYADDINEKAKYQKIEEQCNMKQHWPYLREKIFGNIDEEAKYDNDRCCEEYMRVLKNIML
eukprot:47844_1